jgi:hypothetical protein
MQKWKCFALTATLFFTLSAFASAVSAAAQPESEKEHRGQGYVFFAPGGIFEGGYHTGTAHFGGGGEGLIYKGIGLGAEVGYLTPWRDFSQGIGMASVNGSYHFMRNRTVSPFVTAGYSLGFREGHINLVNFGGGVNWWMNDRIGLRLEFRDHIYSESHFNHTDRFHYLGGRIGFAFR